MESFLQRLSEPSFWRGIVAILTACGVAIEPKLGESIITIGLAVIGLINVLKKPSTQVIEDVVKKTNGKTCDSK
jgi:hypothetical protein